ncbi:MAG: S8 family serine peptidase [Candidatus Hodarchaeales archaeon]|jgi:subtilisin family serine protease
MSRSSRGNSISFIWTILFLSILIHPIFIYASNSSYSWNLEEVGIPAAWEYTQGSSEIIVAIIDSGVDYTHPDLYNSTWENPAEIPNNGWDDDSNGYIDDYIGWDFQDNDNDPSPPLPPAIGSKHGTFIAGLIAADDDNDIFVGAAPNIKIMSLRFLRHDLSFLVSDWSKLVDAILYAVEQGAKIINLSLQANGIPPNEVYEAIRNAYQAGVIIVGVTGNYENHVTYPGNYSEVIAVSATTSTQDIADFSAYGAQNEICAPGHEVYSITGYETTVVLGSGTSYATPLVSGSIALMLSLNPSLTNEEIRMILHESANDLGDEGKDHIYGYGLLNITSALERVTLTLNNTSIPVFTSNPSTNPSSSKNLESDLFVLGIAYTLLLIVLLLIVKTKVRK